MRPFSAAAIVFVATVAIALVVSAAIGAGWAATQGRSVPHGTATALSVSTYALALVASVIAYVVTARRAR